MAKTSGKAKQSKWYDPAWFDGPIPRTHWGRMKIALGYCMWYFKKMRDVENALLTQKLIDLHGRKEHIVASNDGYLKAKYRPDIDGPVIWVRVKLPDHKIKPTKQEAADLFS